MLQTNVPHHSSLNNSNFENQEDITEILPEQLAAALEEEAKTRAMLETSKEAPEQQTQDVELNKRESKEEEVKDIKQALMSKIPIVTPDFKSK